MPSFFLTWIHLVAAVTLIGGLIFLNLVVHPILKNSAGSSLQLDLMKQLGKRFRTLAWVSLIALILTGAAQMLNESGSARIETMWGVVLMVKLFIFAIAFGLLLIHDFILDPYRGSPGNSAVTTLNHSTLSRARLIQHLTLLLTLLILLIASYLTSI